MESHAVVIAGVPGCGKSTFGRALARGLGWCYLDLDTVTNPLFDLLQGEYAPDVPSEEPPATPSVNDIRYRCLLDTAAENLSLGVSVVVVAPFTSERSFGPRWTILLDQLGVGPERAALVWVDTPREEILHRITNRAAMRDRDKLINPTNYFNERLLEPPAIAHYRVDGSRRTQEQINEFLHEFQR